jgi:WhiB family redox-sensing transcriptional regulator
VSGFERLAHSIGEPRPPWWHAALCKGVDPDLFFPTQGEPTKEAKAVCAGCPVRTECLEYALANSERTGVWGGTSERERRALRRQRAAS